MVSFLCQPLSPEFFFDFFYEHHHWLDSKRKNGNMSL
jgi:hypothetical protein